jgi:hypothetical protein
VVGGMTKHPGVLYLSLGTGAGGMHSAKLALGRSGHCFGPRHRAGGWVRWVRFSDERDFR